jgi:hypothetical protein
MADRGRRSDRRTTVLVARGHGRIRKHTYEEARPVGLLARHPVFSDEATIVANKDQLSCDLSGEAVILSLQSGAYYGLNPVGAWVWKLIQEPKTVSALRAAIVNQFEVEPELCQGDLNTLLRDLIQERLIEVTEAVA